MHSESIYKIPGGKLLRVSLDYDKETNTIQQIKINGDFFAYPEESIETLETALRDTPLDQETLLRKIHSIIIAYHVQFIGLNAEGLTQGILRCLL
jgi:lipoate-protein ligase A